MASTTENLTSLDQALADLPINLRPWQALATEKTVYNFMGDEQLFLTQACTGAGKTTYGIAVAYALFKLGLIDKVIVVTPSVEIAVGWAEKCAVVGIVGTSEEVRAAGTQLIAVTYAGMNKVTIAPNQRVLLIADEIHHAELSASWGTGVTQLSDLATYTLCLTGTPWMTKGKIAVLARAGYYVGEEGREAIQVEGRDDGFLYSYENDLQSDDAHRATVPLVSHFLPSTAKAVEPIINAKGEEEYTVLELVRVDSSNQEEIIAQAEHPIPMTPHIKIDVANKDVGGLGNPAAEVMLTAAVNERSAMAQREPFASKGVKPLGLVTCRSIKEARAVASFLELKGCSVELVLSDDGKAAAKLRDVAKGRHVPDFVVCVTMVSEGVDIPAIKVIVNLNSFTTVLFLIQLIGRALRRIFLNGSPIDSELADTPAHLFSFAHPKVVKVALELERIGNQAIQDRPQTPKGDGPAEPVVAKVYENSTGEGTVFYRGVEVPETVAAALKFVLNTPKTNNYLGASGVRMVHEWIEQKRFEDVALMLDKVITGCGLVYPPEGAPEGSVTSLDAISFDDQMRFIRKEITNMVALLRFSHPAFKNMPDNMAFSEVRKEVCLRVFGKFVKIEDMGLPERKDFFHGAQRLYKEGLGNAA